jgi:hypothetical protein
MSLEESIAVAIGVAVAVAFLAFFVFAAGVPFIFG